MIVSASITGKDRKKQGVPKKWNASQTAEEKKTLGKVPSDYTKKVGAGLYEKQNAYIAHFQKRPSIFSYFSHNIQQVPMGYIIRK